MGKTLDRSKPFGEIMGGHRAAFMQDGAEFDVHGAELPAETGASTGAEVLVRKPGRPRKEPKETPVTDVEEPKEAPVTDIEGQLTEQLLS